MPTLRAIGRRDFQHVSTGSLARRRNLAEEKDKKVKELQHNIAAVSFTPQSKMEKMLMAKRRTLQEEKEEIGNQASEGKMHELELKLALQKSQNAQLKSI